MVSLVTIKYFLVLFVHYVTVYLFVKVLGHISPLWSHSEFVEILITVIVGLQTFKLTKEALLFDRISPSRKAVFVTGCDSGFGHLLAKRLDREGFRVFAGCLFPMGEGVAELQKTSTGRLQVVPLDVTSDESVLMAKRMVERMLGDDDLWAVVNNAGIMKGFCVDFSTLQDFYDCLEVNAIGHVRVTKTFLPFVKNCKGRIVNVTSLAGRQVAPQLTPYFMSKHAATGFNDCLRREMDVWGVRVIAVEPDVFDTNLMDPDRIDKVFETSLSHIDPMIRSEYGEDFFHAYRELKRKTSLFTSRNLDIVINDLVDAITLEHPDVVYTPRGFFLTKVGVYIFSKLSYALQDFIVKAIVYVVGFPIPKAVKTKSMKCE